MNTANNYDSEFCGSLPLQHINLIQPYGYLLVLDTDGFVIIQSSENIEDVLKISAQQIVGKPVSDFIKQAEVEVLAQKFSINIEDKIPLSFTFTVNGKSLEFNVLVHSKSDYLLVELEPAAMKKTFIDVFQQLKYIMAEINLSQTVEEVSNVALRALQKIAGFDRVLMYKFDEEWNGTVIAELLDKEGDPYLGLKFPASDIPKQARALYQNNPYRLIPSRSYTPVRLYPVINPATHSFTDLSGCNLRSVAAVHLEYMQNMDIQASMSIRIVKNDKLWGLISCHHSQPKYLNYEICSVFELLSEVISSRINSLETKHEYNLKSSLRDKEALIVKNIFVQKDLVEGLSISTDVFLELFGATGIAIRYKDKTYSTGTLPGDLDMQELLFWLESKKSDKVFSTVSLSSSFEQAFGYAEAASGLLLIPIGNRSGDFILLFRPEVQTTVSWGGNPDEAVQFEGDGKKYHPRNSFKIWRQTVKQTSLPWQNEELAIAESLRTFIFEYHTKYSLN